MVMQRFQSFHILIIMPVHIRFGQNGAEPASGCLQQMCIFPGRDCTARDLVEPAHVTYVITLPATLVDLLSMLAGVWFCVVAGGGLFQGDRQAAAAVGAEPDGLRLGVWQYRVPGRVRGTAAHA